jgi:hypothetical protein
MQFAEQYCEGDIGDLSHEEIEGFIRGDSERIELLLQQFEKRNKKMQVSLHLQYESRVASNMCILDVGYSYGL